jgi:hypothetical protein
MMRDGDFLYRWQYYRLGPSATNDFRFVSMTGINGALKQVVVYNRVLSTDVF